MRRTVNWSGTPVEIEYLGDTILKWGRKYHKVRVLTGHKAGKVIDFPLGPDDAEIPMRAQLRAAPIVRSI